MKPAKTIAWVGVFLLCVSTAGAQVTRDWTGHSGNGDWLDSGNWDPGGTLSPDDSYRIFDNGYAPPDMTANFIIDGGQLQVSGSGVTAKCGVLVNDDGSVSVMDGATLDVRLISASGVTETSSSRFVVSGTDSRLLCTGMDPMDLSYLAADGHTDVTIENGGLWRNSQSAIFSLERRSSVAITVRGTNSQWDNRGKVLLSTCGSTELTVESGASWLTGEVDFVNDWATATVEIDNATWNAGTSTITFSRRGTAVAEFRNNAQVTTGATTLGLLAGSDDTLTVTGFGTNWDLQGNTLTVGSLGQGEMAVASEATVSAGATVLGSSSGGNGSLTVGGAGSNFTTNGMSIKVGLTGVGSLTVNNSGTLTTGSAILGDVGASSAGIATVGGSGSKWLLPGHFLTVGRQGFGDLLVSYNGLVHCGSAAIGSFAGSSGTISVRDSGELRMDGDLSVGLDGTATLYATSGLVNVGDRLHIGAAGNLVLNGGEVRVAHLGEREGALTFESGTFRVTSENVEFGYGTFLGSNFALGDQQALQADMDLIVRPYSSLQVNLGGTLQAGRIQNDGDSSVDYGGTVKTAAGLENTVRLQLNGGRIVGGKVTNGMSALISGWGTIDAPLDNFGQLTLSNAMTCSDTNNYGLVTIGHYQTLRSSGLFNNFGTIKMSGGAIAGTGSVFNHPGGIITGDNGIAAPLTNAGGLIYAGLVIDPYYQENTTATTMLISDLTGGNNDGGELRIDARCAINVLTAFPNAGLIRLNGPGAQLLGDGLISSSGVISGEGRITHGVNNTGTIRVDAGAEMRITGPGNINDATGVVELLLGATLDLTQGMASNAGGMILHGAIFDNGPAVMINTGYISGHGSLRINTLTNEGHIGVGQGDLSLSGSLVHNGTIGVEDGRTLTIFGGLSGGGTTSGTGTVVVYGTVSPGSSPGRLTFGGDLILSGDKLLMELSGLTPGTQADQLVVLGEITVGNVLEVDCIDGWQPAAGDYYRLLEFGSISGAFSEVRLPELEGGLSWNTSDLYSTGAIAVIPEPATLALLALGGLALLRQRRK